MYAIYMVTWIPSIYPLYVSIYSSNHGSYGLRIALLVDLVYLELLYHTKNPIYLYLFGKSFNQLVQWDGIDGYSVHGSLSEREIFGMGYSGDLTIHADYADLTQKKGCIMIASELYTILQSIAILYVYTVCIYIHYSLSWNMTTDHDSVTWLDL
jgi:hypothetical protein